MLSQGGQETALVLARARAARAPGAGDLDVHGDRRADAALRVACAPSRPARGLRWRGSQCAGPTRYGRSRRTRPASCASTVSSRPRVSRVHGSRPVPRRSPAPLPETPGRSLRRRARALQGDRRARGGLAARGAESPDAPAARSSARDDDRDGRAARRRHAGPCRWTSRLPTAEVAGALDAATVLVLPSRSEGLGRVVIEAFCRGRGVVGSRVGGIPDLVVDGESGLLVEPDDAEALAAALVRALDRAWLWHATRRRGAAKRSSRWLATPGGVRPRVSRPRRGGRRRHDAVQGREARLRHAAGRSGEPGARGDGREDPGARGPGRRGRRDRRRCRGGCAARELPRPHVRRAHQGGAGRALRDRSRARARTPAAARRAWSPTCARSTRCSRRRSRGRSACPSCSGSRTGARAGCSRSPSAPRPP